MRNGEKWTQLHVDGACDKIRAMRWAVVVFVLSTGVPGAQEARGGAYLPVDSGRLYYEECGSGPAVVLLHDGLLHSVVWDDIWPLMCRTHHVVRYDRRGYGRSDPATAPFSAEDDLLRVLDRAGMARATLVGSSSGSAVALDVAVAHPERVESLVLIGPVVHGMRSSDWFLERGNAASAPLASGDVRAAARNWSADPYQVHGERADARRKILDALVASPHNFTGAGGFERRPSPPTVSRLSSIQAPTLMIIGEGDVADVHAFGGAVQAAVPVVRREVWKNDGHLVQLEEPAALSQRIDVFLTVVERKTVAVPHSTLARYAGRYSVGGLPATIVEKNGRLLLQLNGDADVPLFAATPSDFFVRTTGTDIRFERDSGGRTVAMVITNTGGSPVRSPRL
jgi:pimeloyl-ACP methyl ester carboxylesterase